MYNVSNSNFLADVVNNSRKIQDVMHRSVLLEEHFNTGSVLKRCHQNIYYVYVPIWVKWYNDNTFMSYTFQRS